ncbi:hypothetical protein ACFRCG_03735 [Embleya sp. NPDC056575]|uniref:hypothetical protein n=1 Tax=unclassified Embleya TaxID=2699296 RepID=UPI0036CF3F5E
MVHVGEFDGVQVSGAAAALPEVRLLQAGGDDALRVAFGCSGAVRVGQLLIGGPPGAARRWTRWSRVSRGIRRIDRWRGNGT